MHLQFQNNKWHRFAKKEKVTNFGFEPPPVISLWLPTQCNIPARVNDLNLPEEKMTRDRIRTPTGRNLQFCSLVSSNHCTKLTWIWHHRHFSILKCLHWRTIHFLKCQFPGKQIGFWNSVKAHILSYLSSNTHAKLAHLDFINKKKPLSYFNFSHQTQHPPFDTPLIRKPGKLSLISI